MKYFLDASGTEKRHNLLNLYRMMVWLHLGTGGLKNEQTGGLENEQTGGLDKEQEAVMTSLVNQLPGRTRMLEELSVSAINNPVLMDTTRLNRYHEEFNTLTQRLDNYMNPASSEFKQSCFNQVNAVLCWVPAEDLP